jgi:hypothetical protein
MNVHDGSERDAKYLASQMQTNSRVILLRTRMQQARDKLHDELVQADLMVATEAPATPRPRPVVAVPLPPIDRTESTPRGRAYSGTRLRGVAQELDATGAQYRS